MVDARTYQLISPEGLHVCDVIFSGSYVKVGVTQFLIDSPDVLSELERLIQEKNYKEFDAHGPDILPYYCRECGRLYANADWVKTLIFEEDGWFDEMRGRCPRGHSRMMHD